MPIQFSCSCGKAFSVRDEVAGRRAQCPNCGEFLLVPIPGGHRPGAAHAPTPAAPMRPPHESAINTIATHAIDEAPPMVAAGGAGWPAFKMYCAGGVALLAVVVALIVVFVWPSKRPGASTGDGSGAGELTGSGSSDLSYETVSRNPAAYRDRRVTWPAWPAYGEGRRMIVIVNREGSSFASHVYAVDFSSQSAMMKAFGGEGTITGTIDGPANIEFAVNSPDGSSTRRKETVPLIIHATFKPAHLDPNDKTSEAAIGAEVEDDEKPGILDALKGFSFGPSKPAESATGSSAQVEARDVAKPSIEKALPPKAELRKPIEPEQSAQESLQVVEEPAKRRPATFPANRKE